MTPLELFSAISDIATALALPISAIGIAISIFTLKEMKQQRDLEHRPDIVIPPISVYFRTDRYLLIDLGYWSNNYRGLEIFDDPSLDDEIDYVGHSIRLVNIGRAAAKQVVVEFSIDLPRLISLLNKLYSPTHIVELCEDTEIPYVRIVRITDDSKQIESRTYMNNSSINIDHIIPVSDEAKNTTINIPRYITTIITSYMAGKFSDDLNFDMDDVVIHASVSYSDITNKRHSKTIILRPDVDMSAGGPDFAYCAMTLSTHYKE